MRDIHNNIAVEVALSPQTIATNTTTVGAIIDAAAQGGIEFVIASGTLVDGAYAVLIESGNESNLSDAAAVDDKFLLGTEADASFALADDDLAKKIGVKAHNKRYVRLSIVSTATTSGGELSAVAVKGPYILPA